MKTKQEMREEIAEYVLLLHKAEENSYTDKMMSIDSCRAGMTSAQYEVARSQLHMVMCLLEMLGAEIHFAGYGTLDVKNWGILED